MQSRPGLKLSVAESLTGGRVQARITAESGASEFFVGGISAYAPEVKVAVLGVDREIVESCNGVSAAVARQMALGACRLLKTGLAVATTGYAEPAPIQGAPVPMAHWAVCHLREGGDPVFVDGFGEFPGADRETVQNRVADEAMAALIAYLKKPPAACSTQATRNARPARNRSSSIR